MSMFFNRKKRKRLHKNRVQFPEDYLDIWGPQHGHRLETFRYTLTVTLSSLVPSLTLESKDAADTTDQVPKLIKKHDARDKCLRDNIQFNRCQISWQYHLWRMFCSS